MRIRKCFGLFLAPVLPLLEGWWLSPGCSSGCISCREPAGLWDLGCLGADEPLGVSRDGQLWHMQSTQIQPPCVWPERPWG